MVYAYATREVVAVETWCECSFVDKRFVHVDSNGKIEGMAMLYRAGRSWYQTWASELLSAWSRCFDFRIISASKSLASRPSIPPDQYAYLSPPSWSLLV